MKKPKFDTSEKPWNYPGMIVCEGRYYYGFVQIAMAPPPGQHGADITGLLWRYLDKPNEWIFTNRCRTYAGKNNDPWDEQDKKKWGVHKFENCTEAEAVGRVDEILLKFDLMMRAFGVPLHKPDWCKIEGGIEAAFEIGRAHV